MSLYAVDTLMAETRRLAAEYHRATQQTLAVTAELARYDAMRHLGLIETLETETGVDAIDSDGNKCLIKGRVIFDPTKSGHRIGQLHKEANWDKLYLVLLDDAYETYEIYENARSSLEPILADKSSQKRGTLSVAKFKALGELVWFIE